MNDRYKDFYEIKKKLLYIFIGRAEQEGNIVTVHTFTLWEMIALGTKSRKVARRQGPFSFYQNRGKI